MDKDEQHDVSEAELLDRAVRGDQDALAALLEQHGPVVRRKLDGQISERWQSILSEDDVMQQTYADAFRDISRFVQKSEGSFRAWLATLARRNLLDAVKMLETDKRGGHRHRIEPAAGDESYVALYELLSSDGTTPSKHATRQEAKSALTRAIRELPGTYRRVVTLYDLEGLPVQEVANVLGRSCSAVFMLRARAHDRLREKMGSASDFLSDSA